MATRPPDFKSSGIRAERIIASGSSSNPRLLLIGSGAAGNDGVTVDTANLRLAGTGSDTWLFISGAVGGNDRVTFGGDVHISGSLTGVSVSSTPAGSNTQVQFNDAGAFAGSPGLVYSKTTETLTVGNLTVTGTLTSISSSQVRIVDPIIILGSGSSGVNQNGGIAIASGSSVSGQALVWGRVANDTWGAGRVDVLDGATTTLASMTLVGARAAKLEVGNANSFVSSSASTNLLLGASQQVLVLSGGSASSINPANFSDTNFFVSGSKGSIGTAIRGVSTFGGDVLVSGNLKVDSGVISGSGDLNIYFGNAGGAAELYIRNVRHPSNQPIATFYDRSAAYSLELSGGLYVNSNNTAGSGDLLVQGSSNVTTVWSNSVTNQLFLSGSQVTVNKMTAHGGQDVNFFVSGTAGSRGTSTRGTSVFSGDVQISGSLNVGTGSITISSNEIQFQGGIAKISSGTGGLTFFDSGNSSGVTLSTIVAGGAGSSFFSSPSSGKVNSTGSLSLAGALGGTHTTANVGTDVFFFVSGSTAGGANSSSVLGGPVVISGSFLHLKGPSGATNVAITNGGVISGSGDLQAGGNLIVDGNATVNGDLTVNGGDILTTAAAVTVFPVNASTVTFGNAASTISLGNAGIGTAHTFTVASARTGNVTINLANGTAAGGSTKNINIGQGGVAGSTTVIRLGTTDAPGITNIFVSGSMQMSGSIDIRGSIVPNSDFTYNLGTPTLRWQNVYTGDLHLRNSRGDWTILEEEDYLCVINNKTGKRYKMMLQPLD